MARIVPSQVVATIDRLFEWAAGQEGGPRGFLTSADSVRIAALLDLVERIPDELLTLDADDFAVLRVCIAGLREQIERWRAHGDHAFLEIRGLSDRSPITLIRQRLAKCPDQSPASTTVGLPFISDDALRESIRLDISGANRDLAQGEWKGATVLAGSAIEALLLWLLQEHEQQKPGALPAAAGALFDSKALARRPDANHENWDLHTYIEVARHLDLIEPETAVQARQAKDFRNLIHPGRAQRKAQKCDRGTALAALAGVEFVVRDLTP